MFSFKTFISLDEAVSTVKKDVFLRYMSIAYDSGDERLIKHYLDSASNFKVKDVIRRNFAEKLPRAERGAEETLVQKISSLGLKGPEKVRLAEAIADGSAYDILGLIKGSIKKPKDISSCVNTSVAGAAELLPWYVAWNAKPDAGTRGKAATEIWIISAGKNGRTPNKGDAIVDGVVVESKSLGSGFASEFSISGKQSSFKPHVEIFKSELSKLYAEKKISVDEDKHGLGRAKKSNRMTGRGRAALSDPLNNTYKALASVGMSARQIDTEIVRIVNASFPQAANQSFSVVSNGTIDPSRFMSLWNACAFAEYKREEGFEYMAMFNRSEMKCVSFKTPKDILDSHENLGHYNISYDVGIGQNKSIGGFDFKGK